MSSPLISIVLCCYNGEDFIKEQIDSLVNQTYPNLEIIISDDASSDSTFQIIEGYKTDRRVKLFSQSHNLGPSKNFEFAVRQSSGEFIAFSDQDDIWLPEKIEKLHGAIGDSFLIYCDSELVNEAGEKLNKKISELRNMYTGSGTMGFVFSNIVWGHAMMIDRKLLEFVLPIPAGIPHDIWIAFKATALTGIKYLDLPLTLYRQHRSASTKTIAVKAKPRSMAKRFEDFKTQLHWIEIMYNNERAGEKDFYNRLFSLYQKKQNELWAWQLFFFLFRHRRKLFMFSKKKWPSQVVEIFKQAKGVSS